MVLVVVEGVGCPLVRLVMRGVGSLARIADPGRHQRPSETDRQTDQSETDRSETVTK